MRNIYLSFSEMTSSRSRNEVLKRVIDFSKIAKPEEFEIFSADNVKPRLNFRSGQLVGFSVSHPRHSVISTELIAVVENCDVGLDAEFWPIESDDPSFLRTIASSADSGAIEVLSKSGRDAGVALWLIKEAALKCSGNVDIDPQHLSITALGNSTFRAAANNEALLPQPEVKVYLYVLIDEKAPQSPLLIGVALNSMVDGVKELLKIFVIQSKSWRLMSFESFCINSVKE